MPKYNYKRRNDIKFINPYTFVPVQRSQSIKRNPLLPANPDKLHTGILKCRLYVKTPLGIPDAEREKEDEKGHKEYPFFSYNEEGKSIPVIPGSSLRGVIRSVFEAATDSCFSTLRDNTGLSRRIENRSAYQPGILKWENGKWHLYQAERYLLAADPRLFKKNTGGGNYTKYEGIPDDIYVSIEEEGNGIRTAITKKNVKLRFGDLVEFKPYSEGTYKKGKYLIWSGAAGNVSKKISQGTNETGKKTGLVYIGETFGKKKHGESIFTVKAEERGVTAEQLSKAYEGLLETLDIYRNPAINRSKGHSGYKDFEHAKKEAGIPVWYSIEDKKLSLASIGRTFYNTSLNELTGERKPCTNRDKLCEACMLFGMVGEESLGSRVRISDARAVGDYTLDNGMMKSVTLKIMGQPRYSYLPFYARTTASPNSKPNNSVKKIPGSYDDGNVEIAGRKFYWHNRSAATDSRLYMADKKVNMNSTMELVMPGSEFSFDIYYDGITDEQLQKLMWCIHFGENNKDGNLCNKLGHGKPLGLGSVKIVIEENVERIFKEGSYGWKKEKMPEVKSKPELKRYRELKKIMDFRGPDDNIPIKYPYVCNENKDDLSESGRNEDARHVWYMKNKEAGWKEYDSVETLPDVLAGNQALHPYQKLGEEKYQNNYRNNSRNMKR